MKITVDKSIIVSKSTIKSGRKDTDEGIVDKEGALKKGKDEGPVELESQFILRLPPTPAAALRAAVRSGVMNLKDRLTIHLETDNRHGTVRFDKWVLPSKVLDLPSVIESHKTLDKKTFYKAADISQIMICKEEDDTPKTDDEESPKKKDKKDAKDKKYLYPHGVTAPLKNVRKRRFRKTLKKKYVDFPEIEKEVKRLFRMDNEAISTRYEVVNAEDEKNENSKTGDVLEGRTRSPSGVAALLNSNSQSMDVAEHDLFGEPVSSSDEEDVNIVDSCDDEISRGDGAQRITVTPKRTNLIQQRQKSHLVTEFSKGMLSTPVKVDPYQDQEFMEQEATSSQQEATRNIEESQNAEEAKAAYLERLNELDNDISQLVTRRNAQELEVASIENQALRQRFQSVIDNLKMEESEKRREYEHILSLLQE